MIKIFPNWARGDRFKRGNAPRNFTNSIAASTTCFTQRQLFPILFHFEFQAGSNILLMRLSEGILYETNLPLYQLFHHLHMVQVDQQWN